MHGQNPETDLLRRLYAGALDTPPFAPFLAALAEQTRAASATLVIAAAGTHRFDHGPPASLPAPELLRGLRRDRVYAQDELAMPEPLRLCRVGTRPERQSWLGIARPHRDFRAVDGALLDRLGPHLGQAVDLWQAAGRERAQARHTAAAAAALGAGWLWLDPAGRVIDGDQTARQVLTDCLPQGRLDPDDPGLARALRQALDDAPAPHLPAVVTLRRDPQVQLVLQPGLASPAPGVEPVLTAWLRAAPRAGNLSLAASLDLSRSEARLAGLLADGLSLSEAAARLGWTIETTRSASKRVFARTGTRGQSDLIRRILNGADWLVQV